MTRWAAPAADAIVACPLDALTAVYHCASGITHLLAEPAPELLAALAGAPATLDELARRLAERFDVADLDREALAARVEELVTAGLLQPI